MALNRWITWISAALVAMVAIAVVSFHFGREEAKRKEAAEAAKESAAVPQPRDHAAAPPLSPPHPFPSSTFTGGNSPPKSNSGLNIPFTDPTGRYQIGIRRILVSDECWYKNVISQEELAEVHEQNKEAVYFQVTLKNLAVPEVKHATFQDFFLRDDGGNTYPSEMAVDFLHAELQPGGKTRGGLIFHIYAGNYPVRLLYRTGYLSASTGTEIFAHADHLERLEALRDLAPPSMETPTEAEGEPGTDAQEKKATEEQAPAAASPPAPEAIPGAFRGIKWGTRIDAIDGLLPSPAEDVQERDLKAYRQSADETFYFDTIELKESTYFAREGLLVEGSARYDCNDDAIVTRVLVQRYGAATRITGHPDAPTLMEWDGEETALEYHREKPSCLLIFRAVSRPQGPKEQ